MALDDQLALRRALKDKLRNRQRIFGGWVSYPDPAITETFARAGFDFIAIDMEHTTISLDEAKRIVTSCHGEKTLCLPRPVSHSNDIMKPLLEAGADGMIVQMVETADQVRKLIEAVKFPPAGRRSYGVNRAHGYGFDFERYITTWNDTSSLILQVESITGVENIETLLAFDAVDGVMVGPYDISGSLGVPGQINHPKVREAARRVVEACAKHKKSCCTQVADVTADAVRDVFDQGYTFVILSSDLFVLWKWAEQMRGLVQHFKSA
jgi:2-keto-3-deoxy-L-rhamnonate aldolase RhmA